MIQDLQPKWFTNERIISTNMWNRLKYVNIQNYLSHHHQTSFLNLQSHMAICTMFKTRLKWRLPSLNEHRHSESLLFRGMYFFNLFQASRSWQGHDTFGGKSTVSTTQPSSSMNPWCGTYSHMAHLMTPPWVNHHALPRYQSPRNPGGCRG